jgi:hypothetical protein
MWYRKIRGKDIIHKNFHNFNRFSSYVVCSLFYYGSRFLLEFNICYIIIIVFITLLLYTIAKSYQYEKKFAEVGGMLERML